jgi:hypothetical protein
VGFNWRRGDLLVGWLRFVVSASGGYPQMGFGSLRFLVRLAGLRPGRAVQNLNAICGQVSVTSAFARGCVFFLGGWRCRSSCFSGCPGVKGHALTHRSTGRQKLRFWFPRWRSAPVNSDVSHHKGTINETIFLLSTRNPRWLCNK